MPAQAVVPADEPAAIVAEREPAGETTLLDEPGSPRRWTEAAVAAPDMWR